VLWIFSRGFDLRAASAFLLFVFPRMAFFAGFFPAATFFFTAFAGAFLAIGFFDFFEGDCL